MFHNKLFLSSTHQSSTFHRSTIHIWCHQIRLRSTTRTDADNFVCGLVVHTSVIAAASPMKNCGLIVFPFCALEERYPFRTNDTPMNIKTTARHLRRISLVPASTMENTAVVKIFIWLWRKTARGCWENGTWVIACWDIEPPDVLGRCIFRLVWCFAHFDLWNVRCWYMKAELAVPV